MIRRQVLTDGEAAFWVEHLRKQERDLRLLAMLVHAQLDRELMVETLRKLIEIRSHFEDAFDSAEGKLAPSVIAVYADVIHAANEAIIEARRALGPSTGQRRPWWFS